MQIESTNSSESNFQKLPEDEFCFEPKDLDWGHLVDQALEIQLPYNSPIKITK